jgi:hypothetical protein
MNNLTEQDNAKLLTQEECLISDIDERLKRLEDLYFCKGQETYQPIDTTEQAPIETEQRWQPKLLEDYYYINDWFKVRKTNYTHHDLDRPRILAGNCFKSEEQANKIKEAIKQYLSTNKF